MNYSKILIGLINMKHLIFSKVKIEKDRHTPLFFLLTLFSLFIIPALANAQTPAASGCDPDYYDTLKSRAWLEAQREMTQNQNLILKPDSILEYTCFDKFLGVLAKNSDKLFAESDRWGRPGFSLTLGGDPNLSRSLNNVVVEALQSYINSNFEDTGDGGDYNLLAGRFDFLDIGVGGVPGFGEFDHTPEPVSDDGGGYICSIMNRVWARAKCMDFIFDESTDGFYTFAQYRDGEQIGDGADLVLVEDRRRHPPPACESIQGRWKAEIDAVFKHDDTKWVEDTVVTYFTQIQPESCADIDPIPTGVVVRRQQDPQVYNEKVCLAPGCYYIPTKINEGSCCSYVPESGESCDDEPTTGLGGLL
jgi:hypothetical protein